MFWIRARGTVVGRVLVATALAVPWLSAGCGDGGNSATQVQAAPEAANAAQEAQKNISENMAKKYSNRGTSKPR
jgi:hypothetical protein